MCSMNKLWLLSLAFLLVSCNTDDLREIRYSFDEAIALADIPQMKQKRVVMILPKIGCTGCIGSAETFVRDYAGEYKNGFGIILTDVVSLKTLRIKLGEKLMGLDNLVVDQENYFYNNQLKSLYPTLIYLDNGEVTAIEYISPEAPFALDSLIVRLSRWSDNSWQN